MTGLLAGIRAGDVHARFSRWLTRGWFDWEHDGYPFWSFFHHLDSWWRFHSLENILFVHYADLLADLEGGIGRVAAHLRIDIDTEPLRKLAERVTFDFMKQNADAFTARGGAAFHGGADTFIHKGTNGRWRGVLDEKDLSLHDRVVADRLSPDCARWLLESRAPG